MDKKEIKNTDTFTLGGKEFTSRFILGSGKFSLDLVKACVEKAGAQIITLALRRANEGGLANILDYIPEDVTLLPNTSGARNAEEAVRIARLSREVGCRQFRQSGSGKRFEISPYRIIMRRSKLQKFLQKKDSWLCRTCIQI